MPSTLDVINATTCSNLSSYTQPRAIKKCPPDSLVQVSVCLQTNKRTQVKMLIVALFLLLAESVRYTCRPDYSARTPRQDRRDGSATRRKLDVVLVLASFGPTSTIVRSRTASCPG